MTVTCLLQGWRNMTAQNVSLVCSKFTWGESTLPSFAFLIKSRRSRGAWRRVGWWRRRIAPGHIFRRIGGNDSKSLARNSIGSLTSRTRVLDSASRQQVLCSNRHLYLQPDLENICSPCAPKNKNSRLLPWTSEKRNRRLQANAARGI